MDEISEYHKCFTWKKTSLFMLPQLNHNVYSPISQVGNWKIQAKVLVI